MTIKAAQFFAKGDIRVVEVPEPTPKDDEALVAIEWCGICGSDLHEYLHGKPHQSQCLIAWLLT